MSTIVDQILTLYETRGGAAYLRELVSQTEHALQTAAQASQAGAPGYLARLSPASVQSLALQGGPLGSDVVRAFERLPGFQEAVSLRRWDEAAKVPGQRVPGFAHYRPFIERFLAADRAPNDAEGGEGWLPGQDSNLRPSD